MRTLFVTLLIMLLFLAGQVQALELPGFQRPYSNHTWTSRSALAPQTVVAQTGYPHTENVTLLTDACDARSGTMRAQWVTRDRTVIWGCWGYNPTGVVVQWSSGKSEFVDWFELYHLDTGTARQLGYQRLHERVLFLRNGQRVDYKTH
jgi:hypothetical protein